MLFVEYLNLSGKGAELESYNDTGFYSFQIKNWFISNQNKSNEVNLNLVFSLINVKFFRNNKTWLELNFEHPYIHPNELMQHDINLIFI